MCVIKKFTMEFLKETRFKLDKHPLKDNILNFRNFLDEFEKLSIESLPIYDLKKFFVERLDLINDDLFKLNLKIQCFIPKAGDNSKNHVYNEIMNFDDINTIRLKHSSYFEHIKIVIINFFHSSKTDLVEKITSKIDKIINFKKENPKKDNVNEEEDKNYIKNLKFKIFISEVVNSEVSKLFNINDYKSITDFQLESDEDLKYQYVLNLVKNDFFSKEIETRNMLKELRNHIIIKLHYLIKHFENNKHYFNEILENWKLENRELYET